MEDEIDRGNFRPPELTTSKMRFYSIGIAAENKALGSMELEVTPTEERTMLDGEVNTDSSEYKAAASDTLGKNYETKVKAQNSVKASWLRMGDPNRMTAPDVRRGEQIVLFQFGDANKFYWMTMGQDAALRRLETVVFALSASKVEGAPMDEANTYFVEWSTHRKHITLSTCKADGEPFAYKVQLNTKEGRFVLTDDVGNYFSVDSAQRQLEMKNTDGSHWDMNKRDLTVTIPGKVMYDVGEHFTAKAPKITLDGVTNVTKDTTMEMNTTTTLNTTINGGLSVTQANGTGGSGKNKLRGGLIIETEGMVIEAGGLEVSGKAIFHDAVEMAMTLLVEGFATLSGGYTNE